MFSPAVEVVLSIAFREAVSRGHAYLTPQPGFFFGSNGQLGPGEFLQRNPFGRISFANADLSGIMDHRTSILEGKRAVEQLSKVG